MDQRLGVLGQEGQDGVGHRPTWSSVRDRMAATGGMRAAGPSDAFELPYPGRSKRWRGPGWVQPTRSSFRGPLSPVAATGIGMRRLKLSGPRPPVEATRKIKPGGPATKDHGPGSSDPDGSLDSRLGLRDQAKAHGDQEYRGPVDYGLNILGRSPRLTSGPVSTTNLSLYHRT